MSHMKKKLFFYNYFKIGDKNLFSKKKDAGINPASNYSRPCAGIFI
jgi:hypothetical protein